MFYLDNDMLAALVLASAVALLVGKWMLLKHFMTEINSLRGLSDGAALSASLRMDELETEIDKLKAEIVLLKDQQRSMNESISAKPKSKPRAPGAGNRKGKGGN